MGNVSGEVSNSQQRSLGAEGNTQVEAQGPLQQQIAFLQQEMAALRKAVQDKAALEDTVAQLREANQNLVLAAVSAQTRRDDAEDANRRQNEFVAMLAHELRNPLAPIGMAAALLARAPNVTPQMLGFAQVIGRQVTHMTHLLDDLLDASRISSGKITLSPEPVLLAEVLEQGLETIGPRIRERNQSLSVQLPEECAVLHGDKVRLGQVFTNLLGNASKYTGEGGSIAIRAALEGDQVVVTISDNGIGIAPELLPHVFDLFTQGPRSLARSEGGLGVGLHVVRNLVGMHGGQVDAYSGGLGMGSSFTVTLPMSEEPLPEQAAPRTPVRTGQPLAVLLIEDNVDACETLRQLLTMEGHQVRTAHDGNAGLAVAMAEKYDVLICDIGLPGLDGLELITHLRSSVHGRKPFAIAVSGYCQPEDRSRALDAGFDHYCVKPVSPDALLSLLALRQRQPG
jgi:signal transduction histidine kinase/ActR/RegA family two-component response regulator